MAALLFPNNKYNKPMPKAKHKDHNESTIKIDTLDIWLSYYSEIQVINNTYNVNQEEITRKIQRSRLKVSLDANTQLYSKGG